MKLKAIMLENKDQFIGNGTESERANNLVNLFYSFASNKPR